MRRLPWIMCVRSKCNHGGPYKRDVGGVKGETMVMTDQRGG